MSTIAPAISARLPNFSPAALPTMMPIMAMAGSLPNLALGILAVINHVPELSLGDVVGGNVVDMAYSPAMSLAVQVAERGQIFTSDNLDLWLPRDSKVTNALQGVVFFGQRIVIVGEKK